MEDIEDIQTRHRKEKKDLQAEIQRLKKSAPKGDRVRISLMQKEVLALETNLEARHKHEMDVALQYCTESKVQINEDNINPDDCVNGDALKEGKKLSKTAKKREKREAKQKMQLDALVEMDQSYVGSSRALEFEKINEILLKKALLLHEIPSDGDCLFGSICHQLELLRMSTDYNNDISINEHNTDKKSKNKKHNQKPLESEKIPIITVRELRKIAAEHIRKNIDDFAPFLLHTDTGEPIKREKISEYCDNLRDTSIWGGNAEIRAISTELKRPIEIIQANGINIIIGEEFKTKPLTIIYHRHAFRLGEHYNSCKPRDLPPAEEASSITTPIEALS